MQSVIFGSAQHGAHFFFFFIIVSLVHLPTTTSPYPPLSFLHISICSDKWEQAEQHTGRLVCYATFHPSGLCNTCTAAVPRFFQEEVEGEMMAKSCSSNSSSMGHKKIEKTKKKKKTHLVWSQKLWRYLHVASAVRRCTGAMWFCNSPTAPAARRWCLWGRACWCSPG